MHKNGTMQTGMQTADKTTVRLHKPVNANCVANIERTPEIR